MIVLELIRHVMPQGIANKKGPDGAMVQPIAVGKKSQNYAKHIGHRANSRRVRVKRWRNSLARFPFLDSVRFAEPALVWCLPEPSGDTRHGKRPCRVLAPVSNLDGAASFSLSISSLMSLTTNRTA
jgi:hypothetical protein